MDEDLPTGDGPTVHVSGGGRGRRVVASVAVALVVALAAGATALAVRDRSGRSEVRADASPGCATADSLLLINEGHGDFEGGAAVVRVDGGERGEILTDDWVATDPDLSPDGRDLAVARATGDYESAGPGAVDLWVRPLDGSAAARQLTSEEYLLGGPDWSPDGTSILYASNLYASKPYRQERKAVRTVPAEGGDPTTLYESADRFVREPRWSPDGDRIAFLQDGPIDDTTPRSPMEVWVMDAAGAAPELLAGVEDANWLTWHPDGDRLLVSTFAAENGTLVEVDVDSGRTSALAKRATLATVAGDGPTVWYRTKEGTSTAALWRLARGTWTADGIQRDELLPLDEGYLYPYYGMEARCAGPDERPDEPVESTTITTTVGGVPGTELGNGFTVADGARLLGDPILHGPEGEDGRAGWTATFVVDGGDPMAILGHFLRQAEAEGMVEQPNSNCAPTLGTVQCWVFARTPDPRSTRSMWASFVRGVRDDVVSDHVVVGYSDTESGWLYGPPNAQVGTPKADIPPAPAMPPLPGVGEPIGTAGETWNNVAVQGGSRLAGPPHLNLSDGTGGVVAILEVTGNADDVLRSYLDHLAGFDLEVSEPATNEVDDATVTTAYAGEAGGDYFRLAMVERAGRPTWLRISGGHD